MTHPPDVPPHRRLRRHRASLLAALLMCLALPGPVDAAEPEEIAFQSYERALADSREQRRVTIVHFTADWCGWCQRMRLTTFRDADVLRRADAFNWVKIDIDASPQISAMFGVRGVPATAWLNADAELLTMQRGYLSPARMQELLSQYEDAADQPGQLRQRVREITHTAQQLIDADDERVDEAVLNAVRLLADGEAVGGRIARRQVLEVGERAWPALVVALQDERLAVRAAAYDLLVESSQQTLPYDPFAEADRRTAQARAWQHWLAEQHEDFAPEPDEPGVADPAEHGAEPSNMVETETSDAPPRD